MGIIAKPNTFSPSTTISSSQVNANFDTIYNDDLVMPLIIFGWVVTNESFKHMTDVNLREAMFKSRMESIEADLLPVGFYSDGSPESIDGWITAH